LGGVRTLKDNEERYLVGSYANPSTPNVWNTPIVQSSGMPQGQSLLIDPTRVAVLDREQVNVMLSTEDRDNFVRNLVTILAELRGGLAVFDVGGVGLVEFEFPT
jgi:HK97 family phage major capsid protein